MVIVKSKVRRRCKVKKLKNYFSHDFNSRNDIKLKKVNMELGMNGIGLYWCIVECLYENNGYLDLDQINLLAYELRVDKKLIEDLINNYDLFKKNKKSFYSKSVLQRLEKINEISRKNKENANKRWGNTNNMQSQSDSNATALQSEYKEKENKIKQNKNKIKENSIIITTTKLFEYIENNFGRTLSPLELEKINQWLSLYKREIIEYAVKIAVINGKRTMNYVEGILNNWKGKDLKSIKDIQEEEQQRKKIKHQDKSKIEIFDYDWFDDPNREVEGDDG